MTNDHCVDTCRLLVFALSELFLHEGLFHVGVVLSKSGQEERKCSLHE